MLFDFYLWFGAFVFVVVGCFASMLTGVWWLFSCRVLCLVCMLVLQIHVELVAWELCDDLRFVACLALLGFSLLVLIGVLLFDYLYVVLLFVSCRFDVALRGLLLFTMPVGFGKLFGLPFVSLLHVKMLADWLCNLASEWVLVLIALVWISCWCYVYGLYGL